MSATVPLTTAGMPVPLRVLVADDNDGWGRKDGPPSDGSAFRRAAEFRSFSVEVLGESCGNDPTLIREVLGLMLTGGPPRLERLKDAIAAASGRQVSQEAHSLTGAFATVGAGTLAATCQELMTLGEQADFAAIASVYQRIRDQWDHLAAEVSRYLETLGIPDGAVAG